VGLLIVTISAAGQISQAEDRPQSQDVIRTRGSDIATRLSLICPLLDYFVVGLASKKSLLSGAMMSIFCIKVMCVVLGKMLFSWV